MANGTDPLEMNLRSAIEQDPAFSAKLAEVVGGAIGHIGESVQQQKQQTAAEKTKFTWNSADNTVTGTMDADYMKTIASDLKAYQGIRAENAKMLAQNQAQIAQMQQHPFANTLAQIAASVAATDRNPITKGIGIAAQRLNPTMQELQGERVGLLGQQQHALGGELGAASTLMSHGEALREKGLTRERLLQSQTDTEINQFLAPYRQAAENRVKMPPFEEFAKQASERVKRATGGQIRAMYDQLRIVSEGAEAKYKKELGEKKTERVETAEAVARAVAPITRETNKQRLELIEERQKHLADYRKNLSVAQRKEGYADRLDFYAAKLDMDRLGGLSKVQKETQHLEALRDMEQFVDRMRGIVGSKGEYKKYTGGLQGLVTDKAPTWLSGEERQVLQHMLVVEKKRVIDFGKAGVRGWAPGEVMIQKLGLIGQNTPAAADKIMDEIERQIQLERRSIVDAKPYGPWDKTPELFGKNRDLATYAARRASEFYGTVEAAASQGRAGMGFQPSHGKGAKLYPWELGR